MYKLLLLFSVLTLSSYNVMAMPKTCVEIGEGGGGGHICCTTSNGELTCELG